MRKLLKKWIFVEKGWYSVIYPTDLHNNKGRREKTKPRKQTSEILV